ncbi:hypothetical protein Stsp02_37190 [Streptomyces sp. NBRC 14336]|nr:hypothetical protein Stsp02_37190 [Streptomyces sp. NBRC 14336]
MGTEPDGHGDRADEDDTEHPPHGRPAPSRQARRARRGGRVAGAVRLDGVADKDDDVWYQSMIASARGTAQIAATAREGVDIVGHIGQATAEPPTHPHTLNNTSHKI